MDTKPNLAARLFANDPPYTSAEDAVARYHHEEDIDEEEGVDEGGEA